MALALAPPPPDDRGAGRPDADSGSNGYAASMEPTLRAARFAILTAWIDCHACGATTPVAGLLVPSFEDRDGGDWIACEDSALLRYIEALDAGSAQALLERAPWVRLANSKTAGMRYLASVCACGALQGDFYLTEPGAPFFPLDEAGIDAIVVDWVDAPLEAVAGPSMSSWTDTLIERHPHSGWQPAAPAKPRRARRRS